MIRHMATTPLDYPQSVTVLLELYKENTAHGRHLETQRQLVSGLVLAIGGTVVGALASLKFDRGACWGLGCVLIAFGLLGTVFSIVQYGKWTESRQRWRVFRRRLDQLCPRAQLGIALTISKTEMADDFPRWLYASKFPLHWLWTLLNFSVLLLGVALAFQPFGVGKLLARDSRLPPTIQTIKIQQSSPLAVKVEP
jgi:hypothetical protein